MEVPFNNFQQAYAFDARQYETEMAGNGNLSREFDGGMKPHAAGMDYGRENRGREMEYSRGGRGGDYGYDSRGMGDRGGGYGRDANRHDYDRFSEGYDDGSASSTSSRERDRERDRDRSRRDRDRRDRRHQRDRDHDRSRDRRDRGRDRDRDRSPASSRYDDGYSVDGSDDSGSYRDRDGRDTREDRGGEKWMTDTPTNTILLRGLPSQVDEKDIRAELMMFGAPVKDVRLMRRSTGASRGFAFVEFQNVTDAQRWMDQKQGLLNMLNQYTVTMHYSTPRVGPEKFVQHKTDWTCSKCGVHNFKRRDYCFKCNISREESDKTKDGDGFDQVGTNPCNTLIFRGLDALTTEESLDVALRLQTTLQSKNVRIIRDPVTNTSRGYGFCEMNSIQESTQVLDFLSRNNVPLEVDGKQVLVAYAKNTFSTVMATLNSTSQQSWDYGTQQAGGVAGQPASEYYGQQQYYQAGATTVSGAATTGEYDPAYYNQATGQFVDGQSYDYSQYYAPGTAPLQTDTTNAAAAVAQAAIAQANAAKNYNRQNSGPKKAEPVVEQPAVAAQQTTVIEGKDYPVYPPPDVSTYQFDKSSGYYYDPSTGLYYDASSQVQCPVENCDVKGVWLALRDHWWLKHVPTITTYKCPHPKCQFKKTDKGAVTFDTKYKFTRHINKIHGMKGQQHDLLLGLTKTEIQDNPLYEDPGDAVCPQPEKVPAPSSEPSEETKEEKASLPESTTTKNLMKQPSALTLPKNKKAKIMARSSLITIPTNNFTAAPKPLTFSFEKDLTLTKSKTKDEGTASIALESEEKTVQIECPVPNCNFFISCGNKRIQHLEKIHTKFHHKCHMCSKKTILLPSEYRRHLREVHSQKSSKSPLSRSTKVINPNYVDPGDFVCYLQTGKLVRKPNDSSAEVESSSKSLSSESKTDQAGDSNKEMLSPPASGSEGKNMNKSISMETETDTAVQTSQTSPTSSLSTLENTLCETSVLADTSDNSRNVISETSENATSIQEKKSDSETLVNIQCPVPKCNYFITSDRERRKHFEQAHMKYHHKCRVCSACLCPSDYTRHMREIHFYTTSRIRRPKEEHNSNYVDPGPFSAFFETGCLKELEKATQEACKTKVVEVRKPCKSLPVVGNTEKELKWFLSWTDEYLVLLEEAQSKALKQLKKIKKR